MNSVSGDRNLGYKALFYDFDIKITDSVWELIIILEV